MELSNFLGRHQSNLKRSTSRAPALEVVDHQADAAKRRAPGTRPLDALGSWVVQPRPWVSLENGETLGT